MVARSAKNLTLTAILLAGGLAHAEIPLGNGSARFTPAGASSHSTTRCKDQQKSLAASDTKLDSVTTNETASNTDQDNSNADSTTAELAATNHPVVSESAATPKSKTPLPLPADPSRSNLHWQSLLPGMMK